MRKLSFILAFLACSLVAFASWAAADEAKPPVGGAADSGPIKLTADSGPDAVNLLTPRRFAEQGFFNFVSGSGTINIDGQSVAVMGVTKGKIQGFGLDSSGNGTVEPNEFTTIQNGKVVLVMKTPDGKKGKAVLFEDLHAATSTGAPMLSGRYFTATCLKATINGVPVRILDDNLDGKISQDGSDAIAIGRPLCALPLYKIHQIGNAFYELAVTDDGSSITATKLADMKTIPVKSPLLKLPSMKSLVLADRAKGQCFDVTAARTGIPEGDYVLCYGVLAGGKDVLMIKPGKETESFPIRPGTDTLKLGPPLTLDFTASVAGDKIEVTPSVTVSGIGHELYLVDFGSTIGRPSITIIEGNRILSKDSMAYG